MWPFFPQCGHIMFSLLLLSYNFHTGAFFFCCTSLPNGSEAPLAYGKSLQFSFVSLFSMPFNFVYCFCICQSLTLWSSFLYTLLYDLSLSSWQWANVTASLIFSAIHLCVTLGVNCNCQMQSHLIFYRSGIGSILGHELCEKFVQTLDNVCVPLMYHFMQEYYKVIEDLFYL
jgi:hypothetical protein